MKHLLNRSVSIDCEVDDTLLRMARTERVRVEDTDRIAEYISMLRKRVGPPQ